MKRLIIPCLFALALTLCVVPVRGGEPGHTLEFVGVMQSPDGVKVSLLDSATHATRWVALSEVFQGYQVAGYEPKDDSITLRQGNTTTRLELKGSRVRHAELAAPLTPEAALQISNNLRQIAAAAEQYFLEHNQTSAKVSDLVGETNYIRHLTPIAGEDYGQLQLQPGETVLSVTAASGESIVYDSRRGGTLSTFYQVKAGDTAAKVAKTMGLTIPDLAARNPGVNFNRITVGQALRVR